MSNRHHVMAPIALDLGASKTGVFSCLYPANSQLEEFSKNGQRLGFVADIKQGGYTLLQTSRTANRHAIRCRTRNKQAKRLLMLVLGVVYGFKADKHREAISHFMNRRGFTYIESQVNPQALDAIPPETIFEVAQSLKEAGLEEVAEHLIDSDALNDGLSALVYDSPSALALTLGAINEWAASDKKRKSLIKPLTDALSFYIKDLTAGAKFRAKYFNSIRKDIKLLAKHPLKHCRKLLFALKDLGGKNNIDMVQEFSSLLCHINNFDLKLLNTILKKVGKNPTAKDLEITISECFGKWICKQWVVSEQTNGIERAHNIKQLQYDWREFTSAQPGKVIQFLVGRAPEDTIPPYESHTNRRPPRCQTLLLNPEELSSCYPDWTQWLAELTERSETKAKFQHYSSQLSGVGSGKGKPLVHDGEVTARQLHLLLDTSKERDPYKLNHIWSKLKKRNEQLRKGEKTTATDAAIDKLLTTSHLPPALYPDLSAPVAEGSFWHLVNRYYQTRRKARSGRYFLNYNRQLPESMRWQRAGKLLTMCQHRPRQLRSQALTDVCSLLGLSTEHLPVENGDELQAFFIGVKGLKTACEHACKAQKRYGADLKLLLHTDPELAKRNANVPSLFEKLSTQLNLSASAQTDFIERNQSFYTLAQLYPLVWGDRSGFGKTCPVCAKDNQLRMAGTGNQAQASRLSTLSMRLIDGALKRLLTHQAHHIANRIWPAIEAYAASAATITIPLILEQNRFDFTENLPGLKGLPKPKMLPVGINLQGKKHERVMAASKGQCPYSNSMLADDAGDIDHIIPRSGAYGILNDEANLIYASTHGNRNIKADRQLCLADLSAPYLMAQFGTSDIDQITQIIEQRLWCKETDSFTFGQYRQFIALGDDTQTAFRHALFLPVEHPLKSKVVDAICHRRKARVNGTQRYMAQLLADIFIDKAKRSGLSAKLQFDYFEVSSNCQDEDSTVSLRRRLRASTMSEELDLTAFDKVSGKAQHDYSHVIDATMAFMIALDKHQGEGALRIKLPPEQSIWGDIDEDGVLNASVYEQVAISPHDLSAPVMVMPRSSHDNITELSKGKKPHQVISRPVFKQNAIGLEFYDLAVIGGKLYKGSVRSLHDEIIFAKDKDKPVDTSLDMIRMAATQGWYTPTQHNGFVSYHPNKSALSGLLFDVLGRAKDRETFNIDDEHSILALWLFGKSGGAGQLIYFSANTSLELAPTVVQKQSSSPYFEQWHAHYQSWNELAPETKVDKGRWVITPELQEKWNNHCRRVLGITSEEREHRPVKTFSMKALTTASGAIALLRRTSADGKPIYQLYSFDNSTLGSDEIPLFALSSPNVALLKKERITKGYPTTISKKQAFEPQHISPEKFFAEQRCKELKLVTNKVEIFAAKATQVEVRNLSVDWVEHTLLQIGQSADKSWTSMKSIGLSNSKGSEHTLKQTVLQGVLLRGCQSDKRVGLRFEGDLATLVLPYKSASLAKLLAP